jgi:nicotinate-nucleotide--dimethylbenzimidazole phosphoribosyltransferase
VSTADLLSLGADVPWPDATASTAAQQWGGRPDVGRLGDAAAWLAGAAASFPPPPVRAPYWVHVGGESAVPAPEGLQVAAIEAAGGFAAGVAAADRLVDSGADLLLVSGRATDACALAVCVVADVEPVAVLPRGAAALDTAAWIDRVTAVRDRRRALMPLRDQVDALLAALDDRHLAAAAGLIARAATRRTPIILDGALPVAAAVLGHRVQPRFAAWWRAADTSTDPVQRRAADLFDQQPLADNRIATADGTAGLLALALLAAAVRCASQAPPPPTDSTPEPVEAPPPPAAPPPPSTSAAPRPHPRPGVVL